MFLSSGSPIILIVVLVVVVLLFSVVGWYISTLNGFRRMEVKIDESESGIDVALTKRFDLLTKMIGATKGYADHEKETLKGVVSLRNPGANASIEEKAEFANKMNDAVKAINVVVERYPDLKASENFGKLQNAIAEVEEHLQAARRLYNSNVSIFNQKIIVFPASIVAGSKFTKRKFFEAEASKKQDVEIKF